MPLPEGWIPEGKNHKYYCRIKCPKCGSIEKATAIKKQTDTFPIYFHCCRKCGYIITESDWEEVKENNNNKKKYLMQTPIDDHTPEICQADHGRKVNTPICHDTGDPNHPCRCYTVAIKN